MEYQSAGNLGWFVFMIELIRFLVIFLAKASVFLLTVQLLVIIILGIAHYVAPF